MATYAQGDVLLAFLTFSDGQGGKRRPVLVLHDFGDADLLVVPVTSHPIRLETDLTLADWKSAGLRLPSTVRVEKFSTIAKSSIAQKLGTLPAADLAGVKRTLSDVFKQILG